MATHCSTEEDRQAIKKLCRIHGKGQLDQLVQDFSYRRRELPDHYPPRIAFVDLDAKEIGRAAKHLLGINEDHAKALAIDIMLPDRRRELALGMIQESDPGDRARYHQRQQQVQQQEEEVLAWTL